LSAYDAIYLALAIELKLPLACGDRPVRAALSRAGVKLA
jgi:predicted nucleic acid-binding protein